MIYLINILVSAVLMIGAWLVTLFSVIINPLSVVGIVLGMIGLITNMFLFISKGGI